MEVYLVIQVPGKSENKAYQLKRHNSYPNPALHKKVQSSGFCPRQHQSQSPQSPFHHDPESAKFVGSVTIQALHLRK